MDRLTNDMKLVQAWMCETRRDLRFIQKDVMKLDKHQEGIEHQISTLNERLVALEKYMDTMASHVNSAIERINTLHVYLKNQEEEEEEQCLSSDDKFNFDEYEPTDVTMGKNNEV